jgi:hypothetical protein
MGSDFLLSTLLSPSVVDCANKAPATWYPPPPVHDLPVKQTKRTKRKRKKKKERKRKTQQDRYFESLDKYARETIRERERELQRFFFYVYCLLLFGGRRV